MASTMRKWSARLAAVTLMGLLLLGGVPAQTATAEEGVSTPKQSTVQLAHERISDAVALYLGSPLAKVKDEWMSVDDSNPAIKPMLINNRTMVPIRFVTEGMGARVYYESRTKRVDVYTDDGNVRMWVGKRDMLLLDENRTVRIDSPPVISGSRTYVPLRAISEAFGWHVMYTRKLITVSAEPVIHPVNESHLIDELIAWFQDGRAFGTRTFEFQADDVAVNDRLPIIYMANTLDHKVYAYNYQTGKMTEGTVPVRLLDYENGELYAWKEWHELSDNRSPQSLSAIFRLDAVTLKQLGMFNLDVNIKQLSVFPDGTIITYGDKELRSYSQSGQLLSKQATTDSYAKAVFYHREAYVSVAGSYFHLEQGMLTPATPDPTLNLVVVTTELPSHGVPREGRLSQDYDPATDLIYAWDLGGRRVISVNRPGGEIVASAPHQAIKEVRYPVPGSPGTSTIYQTRVEPMHLELVDGRVVALLRYGLSYSNVPRKTMITSYLQRELGR